MYQSKEQSTKARSDEWKQCKEMDYYEQANQMDLYKIHYPELLHPKFQQKRHVEKARTISMNTAPSSSKRMEASSRTTGSAVLDGQCPPQAMTIGKGEGKLGSGSSAGGFNEGTVGHVGVWKGLRGDLVEEPDIGWIYELLE